MDYEDDPMQTATDEHKEIRQNEWVDGFIAGVLFLVVLVVLLKWSGVL